MKKETVLSVTGVMLALLHLIFAAYAIMQLPETIPTHFNIHWVCDSEGSPRILFVIAVLPLISAVAAFFYLRPEKLQQKGVKSIVLLLIDIYFIAMFWLMYPAFRSGAHPGEQVDAQGFATMIPLLLAVMFMGIGNYMPVIAPNKTFGFRVSWTLNNPRCWRVTHRFAGRLMVMTGLLMCVIVLAALAMHRSGELWLYFVFMAITTVNVIVPCAFAYQHRND